MFQEEEEERERGVRPSYGADRKGRQVSGTNSLQPLQAGETKEDRTGQSLPSTCVIYWFENINAEWCCSSVTTQVGKRKDTASGRSLEVQQSQLWELGEPTLQAPGKEQVCLIKLHPPVSPEVASFHSFCWPSGLQSCSHARYPIMFPSFLPCLLSQPGSSFWNVQIL